MDIGVVLQTNPPSARVVDLAKRAETYGFSHVWTFDSHILWQEPYVIYSQILAETRKVIVCVPRESETFSFTLRDSGGCAPER